MLLTLIGGYALVVTLLFTFQHRLLFLPEPELSQTPDAFGMAFEEVWLRTGDGERLHGWWLPAENARATLLFFHGNRGNVSWKLPYVSVWHRLGFNVFLFDYRGYGKSTGKPTEEGLYRDAEAAWQYLTHTRGLSPAQIVVLGRSLGGGPATWLATRTHPRALILEATFTSIPAVASHRYPYLPARWLARHRFDNLDRVTRHLRVPLLVIHSPDDAVIPFTHGRALYEAAPVMKRFVEIEGDHNDGFEVSARRYQGGVQAFLAALGI